MHLVCRRWPCRRFNVNPGDSRNQQASITTLFLHLYYNSNNLLSLKTFEIHTCRYECVYMHVTYTYIYSVSYLSSAHILSFFFLNDLLKEKSAFSIELDRLPHICPGALRCKRKSSKGFSRTAADTSESHILLPVTSKGGNERSRGSAWERGHCIICW